MKVKDFIYIGLILIAGVCGAMLNSSSPNLEIDPLKRDVKSKELHIKVLRYKYDSLYKQFVEMRNQASIDSTQHRAQSLLLSNKIKNLNTKINEISFKGYNSHKLDSLIINLYGPKALQSAN